MRTIAQAGSFIYNVSDEGIWVNLYTGNVADLNLSDGTPVRIAQDTDYPWEGQVALTVDCDSGTAFALMLRIPGWCPGATLTLNGTPIADHPQPGTYIRLEHIWNPGDRVVLEMEMPVQMPGSHPMVEETRNHLAVRRGPLVYCLESIDLLEGVRITDVGISRSATFEPIRDASFDGLISDIRLLAGNLTAIEEPSWRGALYRPAALRQTRAIPARLVPYFAWDNRGKSEMTVWLPEIQ
ncbi:MAG: glycoside hydrolase family 127 protein [Chloroflexi bacterium]|nr:glycoside hydrolase family 127 protein [Chloroflexota bacterium]